MTTKDDKFKDFDVKLLSVIQKGNATSKKLLAVLSAECNALNPKAPWNVITSRLTALKRKGFIQSQKAGFLQVWNLSQ